MSRIYCGSSKLPKNSRKGTLSECISAKQVRLYGLKKVNKDILKKSKSDIKIKNKKEELKRKLMILKNEIRYLQKQYDGEKENKKLKKKYKDKQNEFKKKLKKAQKQYDNIVK